MLGGMGRAMDRLVGLSVGAVRKEKEAFFFFLVFKGSLSVNPGGGAFLFDSCFGEIFGTGERSETFGVNTS